MDTRKKLTPGQLQRLRVQAHLLAQAQTELRKLAAETNRNLPTSDLLARAANHLCLAQTDVSEALKA